MQREVIAVQDEDVFNEKGDTFRNRKCLLFYAISNPK